MGNSFFVLVGIFLGIIALGHSAENPASPSVAAKTVQVVNLAPATEIYNNDDIEPTGNCSPEIKKYCEDVDIGEGALADCISDTIAAAELEDAESDAAFVSDACREDVYLYKITRSSNINKNIPLAKACKVDAENHCNVTWWFGYKAGQIISCLREIKSSLAPACAKQIFKLQQDAAEDFRLDPDLYSACKDDADVLCKGVKYGGGRVQACLRDNRMALSWTCEEQLFRQELENADDIRLSVRLYTLCMREKRRFCADVDPGASRVKDCLEANRNEPEFGAACREEIDKMIEARVRDFRLDSRLQRTCETDINRLCPYSGDTDYLESEEVSVIKCLQDYLTEIEDSTCRGMVLKYKELAAEDIRFDVPLAEACYGDRQRLCADVPPGSAQVFRCLVTNRDQLSASCRARLFDEEVRFSENIDFQYPMKVACEKELQAFCKDVPHGEARAIRCLQDHKEEEEFGADCLKQVEAYEHEAAKDYRLNYRLEQECGGDIAQLCESVCNTEEGQLCGGTVLRCLTERMDDITNESCRKEVEYYEKMEVNDFNNDVILAAACRDDVASFCRDVQPGEGRVHECLRAHRSDLGDACRREELRLEEVEAENVELRPGILRACRNERRSFCGGVAPGSARVFRCLADKMSDRDFGEGCRKEITGKLLRRQANWKLDPLLRKACRSSVTSLCASEEEADSEEGLVYKCLAAHYYDLDAGCQRELGRAVHMALFVWAPGATLTSACDDDVKALCLSMRPSMGATPGAVGQCLVSQLAAATTTTTDGASGSSSSSSSSQALSPKCAALVAVAEPPTTKEAFEASLAVALLQDRITAVEASTGLTILHRDHRGNARGSP